MGISKNFRNLAIIFTSLVMVLSTQMQMQPAEASHFRGSLVTVEYHSPTGGHAEEVHVTSTTLTRKGAPDGMYGVNVYLNSAGVTTAVPGCTTTNTSTIDSSNPVFDIQVDTFTISGCFTSPGEYVFESTSCCRIGGILNTPNIAIQFQAQITIDGIHDSAVPTFNSGYMYNIAYDANLSYTTNLGGIGSGNTAVTHSLVTTTSSALDGYGASAIPCSALDPATGRFQINGTLCTGTDTIASVFGGGQKLYALKVRATDATGQYATRDVLLNFDTTTNQAPAFTTTPAASAFTVAPGATSVATFCAQDPDTADTLNFTSAPSRTWITMGSISANTGTTPTTYCVDFTIAPPLGTVEAFNFEVSVYDNYSNFVRSASGLYSVQAGAVDPNASPTPTPTPTPTPVVMKEPTNPIPHSIEPRKVNLGQETKVTITGIRLSGVTWLTVNGLRIEVDSNSATEIVFTLPPQKDGEYGDIYFEADGGKLQWEFALIFVKPNVVKNSLTTSIRFSGFAPGSSFLSENLKTKLMPIANSLSGSSAITCLGLTTGTRVTESDVDLSRARAQVVCSFLKSKLGNALSYEIVPQVIGTPNGSVRGVDLLFGK